VGFTVEGASGPEGSVRSRSGPASADPRPCGAAFLVPVVEADQCQVQASSVLVLQVPRDDPSRGLDLVRLSETVADGPPV
jgi:hypothetical protein